MGNMCVDVKDHGDFLGNVIQTWECLAGDDDQAWIMDICEGCEGHRAASAAEANTSEIALAESAEEHASDVSTAESNTSDGGAPKARRLQTPGEGDMFKLRWYGDQSKCLDVKDHGNWNGNAVQLWDCFEEDSDQYWTTDDDGHIRWYNHPEKCLDVKDHGAFLGNVIQTWECLAGDNDQAWIMDICEGCEGHRAASAAEA